MWLAAAAGPALVIIAPWAAFNTARFNEPVVIPTGLREHDGCGSVRRTFSRDLLRHFDTACLSGRTSNRARRWIDLSSTQLNAARLTAPAVARGVIVRRRRVLLYPLLVQFAIVLISPPSRSY